MGLISYLILSYLIDNLTYLISVYPLFSPIETLLGPPIHVFVPIRPEHTTLHMLLLASAHAVFAAVTCPDTKSLPLPSSPLTNTCDSGAAIFTPANLNGDADVLTIYNGDQM